MYLMYVDESGDVGLVNSPTRYFVLSALVVHEVHWQQTYDELVKFRRTIKLQHGLKLREEVHASHLISRPGALSRIKKHHRLHILREYADHIASMQQVRLLNVVVDKTGKTSEDVFELAWRALIQRFENTIAYKNFPGPSNPVEKGMLFPDQSDQKKLNALLRRMRVYNPIPNMYGSGYRQVQLKCVIEDANFRDSAQSYFIQSVDVVAYLLYQQLSPSAYMKSKSGNNYFKRMEPVLCKVASPRDPQGIVRL